MRSACATIPARPEPATVSPTTIASVGALAAGRVQVTCAASTTTGSGTPSSVSASARAVPNGSAGTTSYESRST